MKTIIKTIAASAFILGSGMVAADPLNLSVAEMDMVSAGYGHSAPVLSIAGGNGVGMAFGKGSYVQTNSTGTANSSYATNSTFANAGGGLSAGASSTSLAIFAK